MIDGATKIDTRAVRRNSLRAPNMRAHTFANDELPGGLPRLRIWSPDDDDAPRPAIETPARKTGSLNDAASGGELSSAMTLSAFFRAWVRPIYLEAGGAATRNIRQYAESVSIWAATTGNPPLEAIDDDICAGFIEALRQRKGRGGKPLAVNTIIKHRSPIQKMLDLAGPRSRANQRAATRQGLFGDDEYGVPREAPLVPPQLREHSLPTGGWTLAEIAAWTEAATRWTSPSTLVGVAPGEFWPAFVTLLYNTGLRLKTALNIERDMIRRGWLIVPRRLMKGGRRDHRVWLNAHAREAIERLATADSHVVPWKPRSQNWFSHCLRDQLDGVFSAERIAEIDKPCHALRARMLTILWSRAPGVAKMVAGHRADVTLDHYVGGTAMRRALDKLPQPRPKKAADGSDTKQLTLFKLDC